MKNIFLLITSIIVFSAGLCVGQNNIESIDTIMPQFNSGNTSIENFISETIFYPAPAGSCIRGKVTLGFKISSSGDLEDITVIQNSFYILTQEAIRVVKLTRGKWKPATVNGEPIDFYMTQQFNFWFEDAKCDEFVRENEFYFANLEFDGQLMRIYERGVAKLVRKEYEEALKDFNEVLEFRSREVDALYNRGFCKLKLNDTVGACEDWKSAKKYTIGFEGKDEINQLLEKYCIKQ